jgi:hypothetical protein
MGIDQIGRKGPPVAPAGTEAASGARGPSAPFPPVPEASPSASAAPVQATALQRLHAGDLTLDGYLDAKVAEATAHLQGLGPAAVAAIRDALREQIASDPGLAGLVQTARGTAGATEDDGP